MASTVCGGSAGHVHAGITDSDVRSALDRRRNADLLLHPECGCLRGVEALLSDDPRARCLIAGTGGMVSHAKTCQARSTSPAIATDARRAINRMLALAYLTRE